jgi:uncharacterized repeat protein (TIGR02543 family)
MTEILENEEGMKMLSMKRFYDRNMVKISYELSGGRSHGTFSDGTNRERYADKKVSYGKTIKVEKAPIKDGYDFKGWKTPEGYICQPGMDIRATKDILFTAEWTPAEDKLASYKVVHYKEQLDGNYELADTEFPLYDKPGDIVTANVRMYDHYHFNTNRSVLRGVVTQVAQETENAEDAPKMLTLEVYYDLDMVKVSYHLAEEINANGTDSGEYTEEVKYGTTIAIREEPEREGYEFKGWKTATGESYQPGETVEVIKPLELAAEWTPKAVVEEVQQITPDVTPEARTGVVPDATPEARTGAVPEATLKEAPEETLKEAPEVTPTEAMEVTPTEAPKVTPTKAPKTTPIHPKEGVYFLEHYKEQLDGTYKKIEIELPLYGYLGEEVTAKEKTYKNYHTNTELSVLTGIVNMPTKETVEKGDILKILTLKVFYDLDRVKVSYDLAGGTGKNGGSWRYGTEEVRYGQTITIKDEPIKEGYEFKGWKTADGQNHQPGEELEVKEELALEAEWEKKEGVVEPVEDVEVPEVPETSVSAEAAEPIPVPEFADPEEIVASFEELDKEEAEEAAETAEEPEEAVEVPEEAAEEATEAEEGAPEVAEAAEVVEEPEEATEAVEVPEEPEEVAEAPEEAAEVAEAAEETAEPESVEEPISSSEPVTSEEATESSESTASEEPEKAKEETSEDEEEATDSEERQNIFEKAKENNTSLIIGLILLLLGVFEIIRLIRKIKKKLKKRKKERK